MTERSVRYIEPCAFERYRDMALEARNEALTAAFSVLTSSLRKTGAATLSLLRPRRWHGA